MNWIWEWATSKHLWRSRACRHSVQNCVLIVGGANQYEIMQWIMCSWWSDWSVVCPRQYYTWQLLEMAVLYIWSIEENWRISNCRISRAIDFELLRRFIIFEDRYKWLCMEKWLIIWATELAVLTLPSGVACDRQPSRRMTGVIILPTQTMHYYKGNSSNLPSILHCLISQK